MTPTRFAAIIVSCLLSVGSMAGAATLDLDGNARQGYRSVESASLSGAFAAGWNRAESRIGSNQLLLNTVFDDLRSKPQAYLASAAADSAFTAMDIMDTVLDRTASFERGALRPRDRDDSPAPPAWRAWAGYLGGKVDQDSVAGDYTTQSSYNGLMYISSLELSRDAAVGFHVAYAGTSADYGDLSSSGKTHAYAGGAFAVLRPSTRLTLTADAAYGYYANILDRWNASGNYRADYGQQLLAGGLRAAYDFEMPAGLIVSPFAGLRYQRLIQDAFTESGRGPAPHFANSVDQMFGDGLASSLGASVTRDFRFADGRVVSPILSVAWRHDWADRQFSTGGSFAGGAERFRLYSLTRERDSADLGVNLKAAVLRTDRTVLDVEAGCNLAVTRDYVGREWYAGMGVQF